MTLKTVAQDDDSSQQSNNSSNICFSIGLCITPNAWIRWWWPFDRMKRTEDVELAASRFSEDIIMGSELSNCGQSIDMAVTAPQRYNNSLRVLASEEAVSAYRWNSTDQNVLLHHLVFLLLSLLNQGQLRIIELLGVLGLINAC